MDKTTQKGNAASAASVGAAKPQGVLVLGMHRSGTSACTRVLNLLGCALSDNLLGAAQGNENGHWEPFEVVALNEKILESAGSSHDDWGPLNADWRQSAIRAQMVSRASQIITDHTKIGPLFAIKDPRICRLADVWLEAATDAGVDPLVLLMLRNPVEVTSSLQVRDLMADGYGELLWLRHVLDAEFYSRGQNRIVCTYDALMSNWQVLIDKITRGLGVSFPRNSPKVHGEISQFLTQAQRHHKVDNATVVENPSYSHWLRATFKIMLNWSEHGEDVADHAVLDEIRTELDRSYDTFARLLLKPELTGLVGSGGQLRGELLILKEQIDSKAEALRLAQEAAEGLRVALTEREADLAARIDEEASHTHSLQELRNAELAGQISALQSALLQRQEELAQFFDETKKSERTRGAAEAELEQERQRRNELEKAHDSYERRVETLTADLKKMTSLLQQQEDASKKLCSELSKRAAEAEQKLADRFGELAQLTTIAAQETERANALQSNAEWLSNVRRLEEGFPAWWAIMPQGWQMRRKHRRYLQAGLFNSEEYLARYPDVGEEGMDPLRHYVLHGATEGRTRPVSS